jgi:NAD+ synthase
MESPEMAKQQIDNDALADEIAGWLRSHAERSGASSLVLGLSGGVDSAVVCALAARAVGPRSVIAVLLPIHSQADDKRDAETAARTFGVEPRVIELTPVYEAFITAMPGAEAARPLALANIKPRLRMTTLYFLANQNDGLVVGTGNKTELEIGYFTKYGDGGVDLLPLGELNKTMVRALARQLGVPKPILDKAPSAGLWEGQTDEGEIGLTYETLDLALAAFATDARDKINALTRDRIGALIAASEHKRRPTPIFRLGAGNGYS